MGETFLDVRPGAKDGTAVFRFSSEDGGCRCWQSVVDTTSELLDWLAVFCGSTVEKWGGGSRHQMGRGARVEVSLPVAACVRASLAEDEWTADEMKARRFVIRNEVVPEEALPAAAEAVARWRAHDAERKKAVEAERKKAGTPKLVATLQKLGRTEAGAPERETERKPEHDRLAECLRERDQRPDGAGAPPSEDLTFTEADDPTVGD